MVGKNALPYILLNKNVTGSMMKVFFRQQYKQQNAIIITITEKMALALYTKVSI